MIHHFLIIFLHSFCLLVAFTTTNCTTEQLHKLIILMSLIFASFNFLFGVVQIDKLSSILLPKVIDDCLLDVIERESWWVLPPPPSTSVLPTFYKFPLIESKYVCYLQTIWRFFVPSLEKGSIFEYKYFWYFTDISCQSWEHCPLLPKYYYSKCCKAALFPKGVVFSNY